MWGVYDYLIWALGLGLEAYVIFRLFWGHAFFRYLALSTYLLATLCFTVGLVAVYQAFGFTSFEYIYFYFYGDALLTVLLYLVLTGLFERVFHELGFSRNVRSIALLVLIGTVALSYSVVHSAKDRIFGKFVVELQQNLYFIGLLLIVLLWVSLRKLNNVPTRLMQITLGLGMYLGAHAALYAFHNMFPGLSFWRYIPPASWILFMIVLAHTFTTVPETARMETRLVIQLQ